MYSIQYMGEQDTKTAMTSKWKIPANIILHTTVRKHWFFFYWFVCWSIRMMRGATCIMSHFQIRPIKCIIKISSQFGACMEWLLFYPPGQKVICLRWPNIHAESDFFSLFVRYIRIITNAWNWKRMSLLYTIKMASTQRLCLGWEISQNNTRNSQWWFRWIAVEGIKVKRRNRNQRMLRHIGLAEPTQQQRQKQELVKKIW